MKHSYFKKTDMFAFFVNMGNGFLSPSGADEWTFQKKWFISTQVIDFVGGIQFIMWRVIVWNDDADKQLCITYIILSHTGNYSQCKVI